MPIELPRAHGDKLSALLRNPKLPAGDVGRVEEAIERYEAWISRVKGSASGMGVLEELVRDFDEYKRYVDLELIFDSDDDFLYRQRGQLKLDNSVIEEFLPHLVATVFRDDLARVADIYLGPTQCMSALRFDSGLVESPAGGGMSVRTKDQDFAISRKVYLMSSHDPSFRESVRGEANLAYVAAELKTNLDKTMFQEASATAQDVKATVSGARYFLLCEWLDMTPISSSLTAIDEVILLRKAKRLAANVRSHFSTLDGRRRVRQDYAKHLRDHPFSPDSFRRLLDHIAQLVRLETLDGDAILEQGYF